MCRGREQAQEREGDQTRCGMPRHEHVPPSELTTGASPCDRSGPDSIPVRVSTRAESTDADEMIEPTPVPCRRSSARGGRRYYSGARAGHIAMTTTAAATAKLLADAGIERVFGLPGGEILVLMDELRRAGVDFVLMRHEANAGIAAAVYGKLRRQPGVVLTTLGPGAANLMLPLSNAYLDQEPLLAISAQIPDDVPASHTHQRLPLHDVYRPVTRYVATITGQ